MKQISVIEMKDYDCEKYNLNDKNKQFCWLVNLLANYLSPTSRVSTWTIRLIYNPMCNYEIYEEDNKYRLINFLNSNLGELSDQVSNDDVIIIECKDNPIKPSYIDTSDQVYALTSFCFCPYSFASDEMYSIPMIYTGTRAGRDCLRILRTIACQTYRNQMKV